MLSFFALGAIAIFSGFTDGTGAIFLDNVQCVGNESTLISCTAQPIGTHNCNHAEDAGVTCPRECMTSCCFLSLYNMMLKT